MENHTVLCNPTIRELNELPIPPRFTYPTHLTCWIAPMGFGFDPKTSDFKVVRILQLFDECPVKGFDSWRVEVYNSSSNSWRQIETVPDNCAIRGKDDIKWCATLFNGAFHWHAMDLDINESILAFHMSDEVFSKIPIVPLSSVCTRIFQDYRSLTVLKDSLALIHCRVDVYTNIDMWVMNEYGVEESWTRYCRIWPSLGIKWPLAFCRSNELLFETNEGWLGSCNLYDQNVKWFQVYGSTLGVVVYSESLVSIKSRNIVVEESANNDLTIGYAAKEEEIEIGSHIGRQARC